MPPSKFWNDIRSGYSKALKGQAGKLHFAAHSHHLWPNCTLAAHTKYWEDSVKLAGAKWDLFFEKILIEAKGHLAQLLRVSSRDCFCVGSNTHEFVMRLLSCIDADGPARILTTDREFFSFRRQIHRLEEAGAIEVMRVPVYPFGTFLQRFTEEIQEERSDLIFLSQSFFDSGFTWHDFEAIDRACLVSDTLIAIDGYHSAGASPIDFSKVQDRFFFLGGGYKYLQAGESAAYLYVPPGCELRPRNTGWMASFPSITKDERSVEYLKGGNRFSGGTFDVSGWYRFNAVMRWWKEENLDVKKVHTRSVVLQELFLDLIEKQELKALSRETLASPEDGKDRSLFLAFDLKSVENAEKAVKALARGGVIADSRGQNLRLGFSVYHLEGDVEDLVRRAKAAKL